MSVEQKQQQTGHTGNPHRIVNLCFIVVFFFSSLLTWREIIVLEEAYVVSQRNTLNNIATSLDSQIQYSIDNLLFYRNTMRYALQFPISTDKTRIAIQEFDAKRHQTAWQIRLDPNRSMPLKGVSDDFVNNSAILLRDNAFIHSELSAALEFSYILQLPDPHRDLQRATYYISRAGYYICSVQDNRTPDKGYHQQILQPYFSHRNKHNNHNRRVLWDFVTRLGKHEDQMITASVALDYKNRWYGVLAMDFTVGTMKQFLINAMNQEKGSTIFLFDNKFNMITSSKEKQSGLIFTRQQRAEVDRTMEMQNSGELRINRKFITWNKLNTFDGVVVKVHTLSEGVLGAFGRISIVLAALWLLFTLMLLGSWIVIRRQINHMMMLQTTLAWRANYDTLTHMYNRGAFFDLALQCTEDCEQRALAMSVIQIDLDYFKCVNDRYGHAVGDRVLAYAAEVISSALRRGDIVGRVGGEEFCIVLPNTMLDQASDVAERIRERLTQTVLPVRKDDLLHVNASCGVSSTSEGMDYNFEILQSIADARLYKAKQAGRNQVWSQDE